MVMIRSIVSAPMKPGLVFWLLGFAIVLCSYSACERRGDSDSGKGAAVAQPLAQATQGKPFAGKKLVHLTITPHIKSAESLAQWFHEETGAVVQVQVVPYEALYETIERHTTAATPESDVFLVFYTDLARLAQRGLLMDLTDFIVEREKDIRVGDFNQALYEGYTGYQGRRYALPFDGDTHVLFYRKSLLAKHNLRPPSTWDDYLQISRTITQSEKDQGIYGTAIMAHPTPLLIISSFMNRLSTFGGELLNAQGTPMLTSDAAVAALEAMVEQAKYALPNPVETDFNASRLAFLSGQVAMVEQWTDIGILAEDPSVSQIRGDWGAVQLPIGTGARARMASPQNAGLSIAVAKRTAEPELAREFALFATRPDIALRLNLQAGGCDPARNSVLNHPEYHRFAPQVSAAKRASFASTVTWPTVPQAPELFAALAHSLVRAMESKVSPREALKEAQEKWLTVLAAESRIESSDSKVH